MSTPSPSDMPVPQRLARFASSLLLLFACGAALIAADRPDAPKVVEEIVAKVNGDIVTRGGLEKKRAALEAEMKQQLAGSPNLQQQIEKAAADQLKNEIDRLLLVQKGKELDINVEADLTRQF